MDLWDPVDRLVDRAESATMLYLHRLHLYAAWRWRDLGRDVSPELRDLERSAALGRMGLSALAVRMRDAYDGPIVVMKGADVAALYPRAELRPSDDIDVLLPDALAAHRALKTAGFLENTTTLPDGHHHLQPLSWSGLPGCIEIHSAPNWPVWMSPPAAEELLEGADAQSRLGRGFLALNDAHQALVLVAHLWRDDPMRRLGQLVDVLLALRNAPESDVRGTAARWGLGRVLEATYRAADDLLLDRTDRRWSSRLLTGPLETMRDRSMIEARVVEAIAPFYALPVRPAVATAGSTVAGWIRPSDGETWSQKLHRTRALRHTLSAPVSTTDRPHRSEDKRGDGGV